VELNGEKKRGDGTVLARYYKVSWWSRLAIGRDRVTDRVAANGRANGHFGMVICDLALGWTGCRKRQQTRKI